MKVLKKVDRRNITLINGQNESEYLERLKILQDTLDFVSISEQVTTLRDYLFYGFKNLQGIDLMNVTHIGKSTFSGCTSLREIIIPATVKYIDQYAFSDCRNMELAVFYGTPDTIAENCFSGCDSLTTINVPWSEGEVAGAPWGATKAEIAYNMGPGPSVDVPGLIRLFLILALT